ncbi:small ribosomal subunit Rsm22 family protein [Halococcus saccharolyticus]|uniref:Methyltransferase type 12 n=1 Tax=Halococcus saccharolyticus DSM 5350 TaxID=1227455 RepID=M0MRY6_9EURY|nr:class I SAM-dependent methyltransferase [Halococcus saccharolyticus]EMA47225.1 methyltransferase type 12 [Halococcus saccharolyticus DSM 5350]
MNDEQREAIRSNAKYLREVRPVDPEEIHEYVDGQPHPAVVRTVLRESAVDLGLVERADGTFVPVSAEPIALDFEGVERFPESHARRLEDMLVERYGPGWPDGESGDGLRERIRAFKESYFAGAPVEYDTETALAYAIYHLPDYYAAIQYVLADLAADGLLSRRLRVLDVGAGVGGPALGLADLLPDDALVEYHAVEPSPAADVLDALLDGTGRNFRPTIHRTSIEEFAFDDEYDLVLAANVLSELDEPIEIVERALDALSEDGSLVALAPADRETSIGLREVERSVADEGSATIYAPSVRLWPGHAPADRGWSFDVQSDLAVPPFQRRLDEAASGPDAEPGEFVNVDVQYSSSILRTDGRRRIEFTPDANRTAKMAESEGHVSERVDLVAAKLSHSLAAGDNPLFKISDGSERTDHYAVCVRESALNRDLLAAEYGALLRFENGLLLWNDDEEAYNLVVDGETVVDRIPV